jgi:hypothetical protein
MKRCLYLAKGSLAQESLAEEEFDNQVGEMTCILLNVNEPFF